MQEYRDLLLKMDGVQSKPLYLNWYDGGGAEIYRHWDMFFLFEIPQYGGEGRYHRAYSIEQIEDLLTEVFSWS